MKTIKQLSVEAWLRDQVGPAYDAIKADPSTAISSEKVRQSLAAVFRATRKAD